MVTSSFDVVVVGGGNAGLCAALSAAESSASVLVLECAPKEERGGNAAFSAGALRVAYTGVDDIISLVDDLSKEQLESTDFGSYSEAQFMDDLTRVTDDQTDPDLASTLITRSQETLRWLKSKGVRLAPIYGLQAFEVDGRSKFWGGVTLGVVGRGAGLIQTLYDAASEAGVTVRYAARATSLLMDNGRVSGVSVRIDGRTQEIAANAVILASGGFQGDAEWRVRYLGQSWDLAKVCGTRYNTGDGIRMALDIGAMPWGDWKGAHAVPWDLNAPPVGDLSVGDGFQKLSYPFGIMVNAKGERFLDEGADFRNYTYAKYGRLILEQSGRFAWQLFDQKVAHLLRDEYRISEATKVSAETLEELVEAMEGVDRNALHRTVKEYNSAVDGRVAFNPNIKDGRATHGLEVNKSNWANTIDTPPYEAYAVTCGITSTFGGVRITPRAEVSDINGAVIPGLYACGEMSGGLFFHNVPGGCGLINGAVFGRIAGAEAGQLASHSTGDSLDESGSQLE